MKCQIRNRSLSMDLHDRMEKSKAVGIKMHEPVSTIFNILPDVGGTGATPQQEVLISCINSILKGREIILYLEIPNDVISHESAI